MHPPDIDEASERMAGEGAVITRGPVGELKMLMMLLIVITQQCMLGVGGSASSSPELRRKR